MASTNPPNRLVAGESDPYGTDLNAPGAKADANKPRAGLCLIGFIPALDTILAHEDGFVSLGASSTVVEASFRWPKALMEVAKVTTAGAAKYTPSGWSQVPNGVERYLDAWGRHVLATGSGELFDDGPGGTNCRHDAQSCWNLLAALTLSLRDGFPGWLDRLTMVSLAADSLDGLEISLSEPNA